MRKMRFPRFRANTRENKQRELRDRQSRRHVTTCKTPQVVQTDAPGMYSPEIPG